MKKSILGGAIVLFAIVGGGKLSAQKMVTLQAGINSRLEEENFLTQSWKSGTSLAAGIDFCVTKSISIGGNMEFDTYPFDTYPPSFPSDGSFNVKASSGNASQIYRISLESKFFAPPLGHFFLYLVTGVSYTIDHIGQMNLTIAYVEGPPVQEVVMPGKMNYYLMHSFGTGMRYFFTNDFGIDLTGKWYSNYSTRGHDAANLGFVYIVSDL